MLSYSLVGAEQAMSYFEHREDYYTKNMTNYDRWHGSLAATMGLNGELSKEQFDYVMNDISSKGRTRAGIDCTFSAPKSVSLAMATDEDTRQNMINAHQAAVERVLTKIELELLVTRSKRQLINPRNAIMAEFLHTMARPTKAKNDVPDLDLHSHVVILSKTFADGKDLALDFRKLTPPDMIKELGLIYRQELAKELQMLGYELEITDSRQGFFELKGFDRATVMEYSNRRKEILEAARKHGIMDMQAANQFSRRSKDEGRANFEEICRLTRENLFDTKKIQIARKIDNDGQRVNGDARQVPLHPDEGGQRGNQIFRGNKIERPLEEFAGKPSLSELPRFGVDDEAAGVNLLLSESAVNRLAKFQSAKVRNHYLLRAAKRERIERIDQIAADVIKKLAGEKYAFSIPEARHRIMAAGVLEAITAKEAQAAMERAELVKLGRIEREDTKGQDVYLTSPENIHIEQTILERVKAGKGAIGDKILSMEESRAALERAEAKAEGEGRTNFTITDSTGESGEQAAAVHHVLVSNDRYVCVDGLAGTGKTTMMERLKWIADEQGIVIQGVCFTGKAADGLQTESGIESTTIHAFLNKLEGKRTQESKGQGIKQEWDFSRVQKCQGREIWAVDEAGLVDMHLMNQLQQAAEARGAQVLFLGDPNQLPPMGAGEPMRQMMEAGMATAHLYDIRRQKDKELLQAVRESVRGDHLKTYEALDKQGNYREVKDKAARMRNVRQEMTARSIADYRQNLLLVSTNRDRREYNSAIRADYVARGELEAGQNFAVTVHDGERATQEQRQLAVKDRIIFTANDRRLDVMNGTMATIEQIDGDIITARIDAGKVIAWNMGQYDSIDYGYAVTNYKAQGMTVQKVVVDMNTRGTAQTRNALYVDISRAKCEAIVFTDDKGKLERQTRHFARKVTSKDFIAKMDAMRRRGGITNNDRYHAPDRNQGRALAKALAQIEAHTQIPDIVQRWERDIAAKHEAEEVAAKARTEQARLGQGRGRSRGFSR